MRPMRWCIIGPVSLGEGLAIWDFLVPLCSSYSLWWVGRQLDGLSSNTLVRLATGLREQCGLYIHKAAGPDGLPGRVIRACVDQLASVFTAIFNLSLNESVMPTCFKQTTIVPVPMKAEVTCLNDYRPEALTSVARNFFGRLVMAHTNTIPRPTPICIPPQPIHR